MAIRAFKLTDPVYLATVHVCVGPREEAARFLRKLAYDIDMGSTADGTVWVIDVPDAPCQYAVWVQEFALTPNHIAVFAHEMLHVATRVLHRKGVVEAPGSGHEALAYYYSWLVDNTLRRLMPKEKEKNEGQEHDAEGQAHDAGDAAEGHGHAGGGREATP